MATYHYHYDPLDRLIQTAGIQRFYNQSRMTTELEGTQSYSVFQQDGRLLAQRRRDRTKDECHLLGTDLQQSVLHAVGADKHHSMAYNAYGHRPVENGLISLLGFNGERADPVTGHYLLGNGYRAFNPVLMRFNSPDSWSPFGRGGINSYGYCDGDPVGREDRSGHISFMVKLSKGFTPIGKGFFSKKIPDSKKFTEFYELKEIAPGVAAAKETRKGGTSRLTIHAHGGAGYIAAKNSILHGANSIAKLLDEAGYKGYSSIRLLSCHSADGGATSLGQKLSNITGLPVKGYIGPVHDFYGPKRLIKSFRQLEGKDVVWDDSFFVPRKEVLVKTKEQVLDSRWKFLGYEPVSFNPIRDS